MAYPGNCDSSDCDILPVRLHIEARYIVLIDDL